MFSSAGGLTRVASAAINSTVSQSLDPPGKNVAMGHPATVSHEPLARWETSRSAREAAEV
jgi:hypothetical protein